MSEFYADGAADRVNEAARSVVDRALRYRKALVAAVTAAVVAVGHVVGVDSALYEAAVAVAGVVGVAVVSNKA